jgi:hypothetical protein
VVAEYKVVPVSMMPSPVAVIVLIVTDTGSNEMGLVMYWIVNENVLPALIADEKALVMVSTYLATVAELAVAVFVANVQVIEELNNYKIHMLSLNNLITNTPAHDKASTVSTIYYYYVGFASEFHTGNTIYI